MRVVYNEKLFGMNGVLHNKHGVHTLNYSLTDFFPICIQHNAAPSPSLHRAAHSHPCITI